MMDLERFRRKAKLYESEHLRWAEFQPTIWGLITREPIKCSIQVEPAPNNSFIFSVGCVGTYSNDDELLIGIAQFIFGHMRSLNGSTGKVVFYDEAHRLEFLEYLELVVEKSDFILVIHDQTVVISRKIIDIQTFHDIDRSDMPQLAEEDMKPFIAFLKNHGIEVTKQTFYIDDIIPTQNQINMEKVKNCLHYLHEHGLDDVKTFMIDQDKYLLDGHHTLAALDFTGLSEWSFVQVHLPIEQLITWSKAFGKVDFKAIDEDRIRIDMLKFTEFMQEADAAKDSLAKPKTFVDRTKERLDKEREKFDDNKERELSAARERDFQAKQREKETALQKKKQEKSVSNQ